MIIILSVVLTLSFQTRQHWIVQITIKPSYFTRFLRVEHRRNTFIESGNTLHIFFLKREIPYTEILNHTFLMHTFGNDYNPALNIPTKHYLGSSLAIFTGNVRKYRVGKRSFQTF